MKRRIGVENLASITGDPEKLTHSCRGRMVKPDQGQSLRHITPTNQTDCNKSNCHSASFSINRKMVALSSHPKRRSCISLKQLGIDSALIKELCVDTGYCRTLLQVSLEQRWGKVKGIVVLGSRVFVLHLQQSFFKQDMLLIRHKFKAGNL